MYECMHMYAFTCACMHACHAGLWLNTCCSSRTLAGCQLDLCVGRHGRVGLWPGRRCSQLTIQGFLNLERSDACKGSMLFYGHSLTVVLDQKTLKQPVCILERLLFFFKFIRDFLWARWKILRDLAESNHVNGRAVPTNSQDKIGIRHLPRQGCLPHGTHPR